MENATEKYLEQKESRVCEFGFVVTNEDFSVIERGNLLIDPVIDRKDWDWYVVKNLLTRKKKEYLGQPSFDQRFPKIRELILSSDYIVGHTMKGDVKALNDECKRYNLQSLDFDYYDECVIYQKLMNSNKQRSVTSIVRDLSIPLEGIEHDAESDAYNTMLGIKAMAEQSSISINELLSRYPEAKNRNGNI